MRAIVRMWHAWGREGRMQAVPAAWGEQRAEERVAGGGAAGAGACATVGVCGRRVRWAYAAGVCGRRARAVGNRPTSGAAA